MAGPDGAELRLAIEAQERLRGVIPDSVVDTAVAALRQQLDALQPPPARRRQATILFADVRGFTEMSEQLDAEQVAAVMNVLWERLDAVIAAHGGLVDKHIGDALMAIWGAEVVREDDAERAVRAALDLQGELAGLQDREGVSLSMRVGVNTGRVLLGNVGTAATQFTAMGDAVNVASRLEHAAPAGGVLISHDTYRHVRGVFDVQPPTPLALKGRVEPVLAYVVDRAKPRAFRMASRGVEGVETTTIGRAADLARLCAEYDACVAERRVRVVLVVGEAGVGKSRLLYELRNWLDLRPEEIYLFLGRATAEQERVALGLLRDVISTRFEILQSDEPGTVADKLRRGFVEVLTADEADVVGHWLGFGLERGESVARIAGSSDLGTVARTHLFSWLAALARDHPAVLLLEDLHWADDETIEVVERLADLHGLPLLVVALTRPTLLERRQAWPAGTARVDLQPLGPAVCEQLVLEVLKHVDDTPTALVDLIAERADGNPFYVEELVKMLIDDGVVEVATADDEAWHVDLGRLDDAHVPATLSGVLQARLDALPDAEKTTLQRAAVVGRVFWDKAVAAMATPTEGPGTAIDGACRRELVGRRPRSSFAGCEEYAFKHALLRDVTYETVLLRDRAGLHRRAAAWIEQAAGARVAEYHEMIGQHLAVAGEAAAAADHLWRAGQSADDTGHAEAAVRTLRRAFALWSAAGVEPPPVAHIVLGRALRMVGELDESAAVLDRGMQDVPAGSDVAARMNYEASAVAAFRGEHEREGALLDAAQAAVADDDLRTRSLIQIGVGYWHMAYGRHADVAVAARLALELAIEAGDPRSSAMAAAALAMTAANEGELDEALALVRQERAYAEASGDLHAVANAQGHVGVVHHLVADAGATEHYADAIRAYETARDLFGRLGARPSEVYSSVNLAQAYVRLGDDRRARDHLRRAFLDDRTTGSTSIVLCFQVEADRRISCGDVEDGVRLLGRLRSHPLFSGADEVESERILSRVALAPDGIERLLAEGADVDLDAAVEEALAAEPTSEVPVGPSERGRSS